MRIIGVQESAPGSWHDAFVWCASHFRRHLIEQQRVAPGEVFLGDGACPLEPWLMTPVARHPGPETPEGKYNTAHTAMRSVVERCIGLLKSRFRCLQRYRTLQYEPHKASDIVAACCALHNLCLLEPPCNDGASSSSSSDDEGDDMDDSAEAPSSSSSANFLLLRGREVQRRIVARFSVANSRHTAFLQRVRRRLHRQMRLH